MLSCEVCCTGRIALPQAGLAAGFTSFVISAFSLFMRYSLRAGQSFSPGTAAMTKTPIKLGISSCLLGAEVRYNGGHSRDHFITDTLGLFVSFVPVCPEVECGFPVPREALRLVGDPDSPRLVTSRTNRDHTEQMLTWCARRVRELEEEDLCGFIFKKASPSSGMRGVKVYTEKGIPSRHGVGMFARAFMDHFPLLPVEDDGRLHDPGLRENFIQAVFVMKRWREIIEPRPTRKGFVEFHTRHKLLIMSHSSKHLRRMGKMVADIKNYQLTDFSREYQKLLMEALRLKATVKKNTDVLQHIMGYFKKELTGDEKQELIEIINNYKAGHLPLVVPVTLLNHYVRKHDQSYLKSQAYLNPHPVELRLRNHV